MSLKVYTELNYIDPLPAIKNATRKAVLAAAANITAQAKALCPVGETGELRSSIGWEMEGQSGGFEGDHDLNTPNTPMTAYVGSNVMYAIYQECGTRYMPASPFIRPAIELAKQSKDFIEIMKRWNEIREGV